MDSFGLEVEIREVDRLIDSAGRLQQGLEILNQKRDNGGNRRVLNVSAKWLTG